MTIHTDEYVLTDKKIVMDEDKWKQLLRQIDEVLNAYIVLAEEDFLEADRQQPEKWCSHVYFYMYQLAHLCADQFGRFIDTEAFLNLTDPETILKKYRRYDENGKPWDVMQAIRASKQKAE